MRAVRLSPLVALTVAGCFASKGDVVLLQNQLNTMSQVASSNAEVQRVQLDRAVAQIVASNLPGYQVGEFVLNNSQGWQEFAVSSGTGLHKIDRSAGPISYALGVLGMPGLTAYTGLANIGQPQKTRSCIGTPTP